MMKSSSESATWLRDHWKESLAYVKPELDRILADGINHIFYHGTVFSPQDAAWPGWLFYASTQFQPNNTWWDDFGALNTCTLPKFIVHGESDELISIKEIRKFSALIPEPKELVTIKDARKAEVLQGVA